MRFDTPVHFQRIKNEYDEVSGDYNSAVSEEMRYASVTNAGVSTLNLLFGELKQGCLTIRLQNPYDKPFDRIRIGLKFYQVDFARHLRTKHTLVVSEVQ